MQDKYNQLFEAMRKVAQANIAKPKVASSSWKDNSDADAIDAALKAQSEDAYREIATTIVQGSCEQLKTQNESKNDLKKKFTTFFIWFLSTQYIVIVALIFIQAFCSRANISNTVLVTYIGAVFIETISSIAIMIKYAFDSTQEVNILTILNGIITNYQKFGTSKKR